MKMFVLLIESFNLKMKLIIPNSIKLLYNLNFVHWSFFLFLVFLVEICLDYLIGEVLITEL